MRKNLYGRILKGETKEQQQSTIPKSCSIDIIQTYLTKRTKFLNIYS